MNKLLLDSKETIQEQELLLVETENLYGKKLLELEQLNSYKSHEKIELEELLQGNYKKGKEIDEIQKEIKKQDTAIERKQIKVISLNKIIEEVRTLLTGNSDYKNIKYLYILSYRYYRIGKIEKLIL